jgi:hypothetical protein
LAETFYTLLTNVSKQKLASAYASGQKVSFSQMAVGDGNGSYYNPEESQIKLKKEVWRGPINQISIDNKNPNWIIVETILSAEIGGFTIREAGVFDQDGDLIAIGKYPETFKPTLTSGSSKDLYIRTILEVTSSSAVTLLVDPSAVLATKDYVDSKIATVSIPDASLTVKGKTSLSNDIDSDIEDQAATPKAVKAATLKAKAYTDDQISLVTATGIPKLVSYPLQVIATEDKQKTFEIPLDTFDGANDTLIVIINRAFLDASQYTVKSAVRDEAGELVKRGEIELTKGVNVDSKISLVVLKNVPIGSDGSINGAVLATESVPINRVNGLQAKLDEAFQAGNERKSELVAALIAKGIEATTDDSWSDLLDKIDSIIEATGDATAGDIRQGKKATTDNGEIVGTMPTHSDVFKVGSYFNDLHNTFLDSEVALDSGYYPENTKVRIQINDSNFKSENIKSGVTIFGEEGSYKGNILRATVTVPANSTTNVPFENAGLMIAVPLASGGSLIPAINPSITLLSGGNGGLGNGDSNNVFRRESITDALWCGISPANGVVVNKYSVLYTFDVMMARLSN